MLFDQIKEVKTKTDCEECFTLFRELRGHLSLEEFFVRLNAASTESGYKLLFFKSADGAPLALLGFRVLTDFVHGRHFYIDDLVVSSTKRSGGVGKKLLEYAEEKARELNCEGLRLCTGIDNESAKLFYEKCHWKLRAVAFKKKLSANYK